MSRFHTCCALSLVGGFLLAAPTAQAQSGAAAIKKVADSYAALNTYEGTSSLDARIVSKGKPLQSAANTISLKFKQPNKINLQVSTNRGSLNIVSDGKDLIIYDARSNAYIKVPAPADGKKLLQEIAGRAGVSAFMDPLFFLTKFPIPSALSSFAVKGNETYNGHPVTVITGVEKSPKGQIRNWKWWVDKQTNLLRKIEGTTQPQPLKVTRTEGKKKIPMTIQVSQLTRHIIAELKPNPNLSDGVFHFAIPPNATLKKSVNELMKGK